MRSLLSVVATVLLWVTPSVAEPSLAVVDVQRVMQESRAGKDARQKLEKEREARQARVKVLEEQVAKLQQSVKHQVALLSADAREKKLEDLRAKEGELQTVFASQQDELRRHNDKVIRELVEKIQSVSRSMAEERGMRFVIESGDESVVYVSSRLDITDAVIAGVDKVR